jgi:hypothetical protein
LILRDVDQEALGRAYCNNEDGTRQRRAIMKVGCFEYDIHARAGSIINRAIGSTQGVIDEFRHRLRIDRCLVEIDAQHLLPERLP